MITPLSFKGERMNIAVYCAASKSNCTAFDTKKEELGKWMAKHNHTLVYGGGNTGLMGVVATAVMNEGGEVIGVMPQFFVDREIAKQDITKLHIVDTMSQRKNQIIALSEVYIALPGGPGTLEEISEVVSWVRVGQTNGICIFYNMEGYYDHLEAFFDIMVEKNLLSKEDRRQIHFAKTLAEIEELIEAHKKR